MTLGPLTCRNCGKQAYFQASSHEEGIQYKCLECGATDDEPAEEQASCGHPIDEDAGHCQNGECSNIMCGSCKHACDCGRTMCPDHTITRNYCSKCVPTAIARDIAAREAFIED